MERWTWVALGLNILFFCVLLSPMPLDLRGLISDWANLLLPLVNVGACFSYRRRTQPAARAQLIPLLLGLNTVAYVLAQGIYMVEVRVLHVTLTPSWSDIFYLLEYPLLIGALLRWPTKMHPEITRARLAADAVLVTTALFAFSWFFVIAPLLRSTMVRPFGAFVDIVYPVMDVAIVAFVLLLARRGVRREFGVATAMIVFSTLFVVISDLGFARDSLGGSYVSGAVLDIGWTVSLLLSNWAGILIAQGLKTIEASTGKQNDEEELALPTMWQSLLPYLLLPAVGALVVYVSSGSKDAFTNGGVYICASVLLLVLLMRQVLSIKETNTLYTRLSSAFGKLERSTAQVHEKVAESELLNEDLREMAKALESKNKSLALANERLEHLATRDGMTGICNHRAFQEMLRDNIASARRNDLPLSLLLMDVDFFKPYNDQFGHPAGDEVLRRIAGYLLESVRPLDVAARYGGEEFAVILPDTDREEAMAIAERIRTAIAGMPFEHRRVTVSVGVSFLTPASTAEQLVEQSDRALYFAKSRGRNQVVVTSELLSNAPEQEGPSSRFLSWDPSNPMGMATIVSAGMRCHPRALVLEPHAPLAAGLLATLEIKGAEMRGHSERLMWFAMRLAQEVMDLGLMNLSEAELRALAYGALLHDLGKMGISDAILMHPSSLSPEMRERIEQHPELGSELIEKFPNLSMALPLIKHHHERWDGSGYPLKLQGESIPRIARIFAVVDALEAMSSDRPYSAARPYASIRQEIEAQNALQFDPEILKAFLSIPAEEWDALRQHDPMVHVAHPTPQAA